MPDITTLVRKFESFESSINFFFKLVNFMIVQLGILV